MEKSKDKKTQVLVIGRNGQLGSCLHFLSEKPEVSSEFAFSFVDFPELNLTDENQIVSLFEENALKPDKKFDVCINAAAYTAVDLAETEKELAYNINALGPKYLAEACKKHNVLLVHVSTDYVFDGNSAVPYRETDPTDPVNYYGESKLAGENFVLSTWEKSLILRTAWLYSPYGKNFVKTMLYLLENKDQLSVIEDQKGSPTSCLDLALAIMQMIPTALDSQKAKYGIYHFSNLGETSWFGFTQKIAEFAGFSTPILPITTEQYPTPAKRPKFSLLDKSKIREDYNIRIPSWEESLKLVVEILMAENQ
ncbi:MAG: dTDP-4-dehydrorhamnose reductase [Flavobacteriaceae bacterium]|nr:MAG: dTDP-4-dehydrorhamnose reductase [Flavobacteriaceae bacterium]